MEVILLESIDGLGRKGEIVKVRAGFGRNHLLPHHKALPVTPDNLFRLESLKKRFAVEEAKLLGEVREVAERLEGLTLELTAKTTPEGHLFGSVNALIVVEALAGRGFVVPERAVRMGEPIKAVGTYPVTIRLHAEVEVPIQVVVDAEGGLLTETEDVAAAAEAAEATGTTAESAQEAEPPSP